MPYEPKLEQYLAQLDKALKQISVGDRSDIITEIKSHILESIERNPDQNLNQVLAALGEPETVANRYLLERGFKPGKPAKVPMIKWLTIGFLGTIGMTFLFITFMVWKFSPLIQVDEETDRVILLGGIIDIDGHAGSVNVDGMQVGSHQYEGEEAIDVAKVQTVAINFKNGKFNFTTSKDNKITWNCKLGGSHENPTISHDGSAYKMSFDNASSVKCTISIPAKVALMVEGMNGKLQIERPRFPVDVRLMNGAISFDGDKDQNYKFATSVVNGKVTNLNSSEAPDALPMKFALTNGKISAVD